MTCNACGDGPKRKDNSFTKAVVEIDNPDEVITLMRKVVIPASMGDDTAVPPVAGKYKNVLLYYEANSKSYLYSSDGIPTLLANGVTDYEQAVNLPQINGVELKGDKSSFDLGLQGEISNIEQYARFFDTVADMKASTDLENGDYARTLGFHNINDGGDALYKIRTVTNDDVVDEMFIIALSGNNLVAELIYNDEINVKQLGASGDGVNDDTLVFVAATTKIANIRIHIPSGTYIVNESLALLPSTTIYGDGFSSVLTCSEDMGDDYLLVVPSTSSRCTITNILLDGGYKCNGIYDGKTEDSSVSGGIRTHIINVKIFYAKNALYLNAMGSLVDDCQFYGEYAAPDDNRSQIGIYVKGTDNGISNTRISGFGEYGIYNYAAGTRFANVKSYLNGVGVYLSGYVLAASTLWSEENFHDNFQIIGVVNSTLHLVSSAAGTEFQNGSPEIMPTTLNNYSYLDIENCRQVIITISFGTRIKVKDETWSCAGYVIKMERCMGVDIRGNCYTFNESTVYPELLNIDNLVGNKIVINGIEYPNDLYRRSVTLYASAATTINSQNGEEYNVTIKPEASGGANLFYFDYDLSWTNLALFNRLTQAVKCIGVNFIYGVSGQQYVIPLTGSVRGIITSGLSMFKAIVDIATDLANDTQYQDFLSQGLTFDYRRIYIEINIDSSIITNRNNIKGLLEVYTN